MKRFYCYGKKDFCYIDECLFCRHCNGEGGEDVEIPEGATLWWYFCFLLKKRFKTFWYKLFRK